LHIFGLARLGKSINVRVWAKVSMFKKTLCPLYQKISKKFPRPRGPMKNSQKNLQGLGDYPKIFLKIFLGVGGLEKKFQRIFSKFFLALLPRCNLAKESKKFLKGLEKFFGKLGIPKIFPQGVDPIKFFKIFSKIFLGVGGLDKAS
jgi:hypothetical protein